MEKVKNVIEQPPTLRLDDTSRIDASLGLTIGMWTAAFFLGTAVIKLLLNCYHHYARLLSNVENAVDTLSELKEEQTVNFKRINEAIHELQISHNVTGSQIVVMQKTLDAHTNRIEILEAATNKLLGKLGDP